MNTKNAIIMIATSDWSSPCERYVQLYALYVNRLFERNVGLDHGAAKERIVSVKYGAVLTGL